jgi:RNA polymerase sigma-70 factor, ECF subfamily
MPVAPPGPHVLAVTTRACPNCRAMAPVVAAAAERHAGTVALVAVDVTGDPETARSLGVRGVPTYIARSPRGEVARRTGRMSPAELDALFTAAGAAAPRPGRIGRHDRRLRLGAALVLGAVGIAAASVPLVVIGAGVAALGVWDLVVPRRWAGQAPPSRNVLVMATAPTPSIVSLFERLADGVYTLGARVTRDRHLAEDIVQETFLRALTRLDTWRGEGSIDAWIYRIAYHQSIAVLRRRKDVPADPATLRDLVADPEGGVERRVLTMELAARLDAAIGALAPTLRAAFVLRDVEGLPTRDVAVALELSESAVKMRLKRARLALRDQLEDYL